MKYDGAVRLAPVLLLIALAPTLSGCLGGDDIDPTVCEPVGEMEPICGFSNPEDLALLPNGRTLIVSQYGSMFTAPPGSLVLYDTQSRRKDRLPDFTSPAEVVWADVDCPGPPGPAFSPHGINLTRRADGALQLLVVNHGGGERIEFFEIRPTSDWYRVDWRGCIVPPENTFINSVTATPEGGVIFTHMYDKDSPRLGVVALAAALSTLGLDSGYAMEWKGSGREFHIIESSRGGFPNGLQVDAAGRYLYMNTSTHGTVYKIDRESGERVASAEGIPHLDNMQWDASGRLLVVSQGGSGLTNARCLDIAPVNCGTSFDVVRIDPQTLAAEVVFHHDGGQPMGAATVAAQVGEALYIGSYASNRVVRVPYSGGREPATAHD